MQPNQPSGAAMSRVTEEHSVLHYDITLVSNDNQEFTLPATALTEDECGYVEALLRSGMRECDNRRVQLAAISGQNLSTAVDFLRSSEPMALQMETIQEVLETATYLQMPRLVEECFQFLEKNMDPDNILDVIAIAEQFAMKRLQDMAHELLNSIIVQFSVTSGFLEMDASDVINLLASDELVVKETDVLTAVLKWFEHDIPNRTACMSQVLDVIRFPLMTARELGDATDTLRRAGLLDKSSCGDKLTQAWLLDDDPFLVHKEAKTRLRRTVTSLVALGGFTGRERSTNRFQLVPLGEVGGSELEFQSNKAEKLPSTLCEHSACVLDNFLYIAGGQIRYCQDGRYTSNTVYRFDPRFFSWLQVCPMQTPRSLFHLSTLDGEMYAVAGWRAPNSANRSVEKYNPQENRWHYVASLDIGLHEHAGCTHDSRLYITGGFKGPARGHLDRAWCFGPSLDKWGSLSPMLQARSYHAMAALGSNKQLVVMGGVNYSTRAEVFEDVQSCELYDIASDQWSEVTSVPRPASCMGHFQHKDQVYLLGGHSFTGSSDHASVQVLNTSDWTWREMTMTSSRILHFQVVVMELPALLVKTFVK